MLAAKAALAIRYDALAEGDAEGSVDFAIEARTALEKRARELELRKAKIGGHRIGFRLTAAIFSTRLYCTEHGCLDWTEKPYRSEFFQVWSMIQIFWG